MEPMLAQITMFAGNFAPRGWAFCSGQLLAISQYQALFSILGTTYGGDGRTTFALPDLRGRAPMHSGHGPGLSDRVLGQRIGTEWNNLTVNNLPSHTHTATLQNLAGLVQVSSSEADHQVPVAGDSIGAATIPAGRGSSPANLYTSDSSDVQLHTGSVSITGGNVTVYNNGASQSVYNMQPSLALNYIIAMVGVFPSRG